MTKTVFIDGKAGTTGLRIYERLAERNDLSLLLLDDTQRKDPACRKEALNSADIAFLCLPDAAARESVSLVQNPDTVIIDTSTAHRTHPDWAYGFPELSVQHKSKIQASKRIAVPGCHAGGFIALIYPLIEAGAIAPNTPLTCFSLTGYSGGGKSMIADYQSTDRDPLLDAPRQYGIAQTHKHLPEMQTVTGLSSPPIFCPIVGDFYSGMEVTVPLFGSYLQNGFDAQAIKQLYREKYCGPIVNYTESADENGFLSAVALGGKDSMQITVAGNDDRLLLIARYDNLGKGASGAAIQCLNTVLGIDPTTGLSL
ncbi:MAG: N-acetyl-gamma-glutamyl-phosphate reductase [Clostridia bacterium]|nr:N-acetyl-gamma-glutamyl-phosphate reductase [Clostridia bacterium]